MAKKKIALVTGGSRGLGKDMALSLSKKGLDVVLTYNTGKQEAESVVAEIQKAGGKAVALPGQLPKTRVALPIQRLLSGFGSTWVGSTRTVPPRLRSR